MIKRIQIKNYRSCLSTTFDLNPNLSVLIGPNGSGKTNILKAITLLRSLTRDEKWPKGKSMFQSKLKVWFDLEGKTAILNAMLNIETDNNNNDEIVSSHQRWNLEDFSKNQPGWDISLANVARWNWYHSKKREVPRRGSVHFYPNMQDQISNLPDSVRKAITRVASFASEMKYYGASRFTNPGNCAVSFEIEDEEVFHRDAPRNIKFLQDLYNLYKNSESKDYRQFVSIIGPSGIGLIQKIDFEKIRTSSMEYSVKTGGKIRKLTRNKSLIVPHFKIGGRVLSPNQLSEGTFRTITMLFYLITEKSTILLIEEPEVCVHHGLLSSIIEIIKTYSREKQIVISTHSDLVLDRVSPKNVYKVSMDSELGTQITNIEKSMSGDEFNALKEYLDKVGNLGEYWKHGALD